MKRNFTYVVIASLCLTSNGLYADTVSVAKVIKHKESVTGDLKIRYTIVNKNQNMMDGLMRKSHRSVSGDNIKKFIHSSPFIRSVDTIYNSYDTVTKINSSFSMNAYGFKPYDHPELFTIYRETCIRPYPENPDSQLTCVNTEDEVLVDDILIINYIEMHVEAYNLRPGKYITFSSMFVKKYDSDIAYLTDGNTVEFTV